jgi:hypothetical protein
MGMSTTIETQAGHPAGARRTSNFVRHFLEMMVAMFAGMAVFGALVAAVLYLVGLSELRDFAAVRAIFMATNMTAGMALWMRYRGHGWAPIGEMGLAMFVPFLVLLGPFWAHAIEGGALLAGGHVLMVPAMLGVMLLRRDHYSMDHHH